MSNDLLYQLALCLTPHIGYVHAKTLAEHFGSAQSIFNASKRGLEKLEGIGEVRARSLKNFRDFSKAEKEILFLEKYRIKPLFLTDANYPQRLLHCYDPPTLLFYKGSADLNAPRMVAIVGTRNNSDYGKHAVEKLVKELEPYQPTIVSGLAFGIDAIAHRAAMKYRRPTIGVIGHGLDTIYPPENTSLAKDMLGQGGILTEFRSNTKPDKHNFPSRNRVVAGLSDAIIIIESRVKGGSMITADIAMGYNRDVFAIPGRINDSRSEGCNWLIMQNKAMMFTDISQLAETMGWKEDPVRRLIPQQKIFVDLPEEEKNILNIIGDKQPVSIDQLNLISGLSMSRVASAILRLELELLIRRLPGKMYQLMS